MLPQQQRLMLLSYANYLAKEQTDKKVTKGRKSGFGVLREKIRYIADDFDAPLTDLAEQ